MERAVVQGVQVICTDARITLAGVPDRSGSAARIFQLVAALGIEPNHVWRGLTRAGHTDLSFTLPRVEGAPVTAALLAARDHVGFARLVLDENVAEVVLIGSGMRSDPLVLATFCAALARCAVSLSAVSIGTDRLSVLCVDDRLGDAVRALREAFEISAPPPLLSGVHSDEA